MPIHKQDGNYAKELRDFQVEINHWDQPRLLKEHGRLSNRLEEGLSGIHSHASKNEMDKKRVITEEMDFVQRKIGALELEIGFRKARGEWAW